MTLDPATKAYIIARSLSGQDLVPWMKQDWSGGRRAAVEAGGCWQDVGGWYVERQHQGLAAWVGKRYVGPPPSLTEQTFDSRVRRPDATVPWTAVADIIQAAPEGMKQDYRSARDEFNEWVRLGGHDGPKGGDRETHQALYDHSVRGLNFIGRNIIEAGCTRVLEQLELDF